jgi:hypothetical protein
MDGDTQGEGVVGGHANGAAHSVPDRFTVRAFPGMMLPIHALTAADSHGTSK